MKDVYNTLPATRVDSIMLANSGWPAFSRSHQDPINTTIGILGDPIISGAPWQPSVVRECRRKSLDKILESNNFGYQSQQGYTRFLDAVGSILFSKEIYSQSTNEILSYQTLGGTGALSLTKDILKELLVVNSNGKIPLILDSGWPNHNAIFSEPFDITKYQHLCSKSLKYNHQAAINAFSDSPENSVFLLQTCGYNDDGMDRNIAQWNEIIDIAIDKNAVILFDSAYMGLVKGFDHERYPIDQCIKKGLLTFVAYSASKNMGLYNERLGALFIANAQAHLGSEQFNNLNNMSRRIIRKTISNPALHCALAAADSLESKQYYDELDIMRQSLQKVRMIVAEILNDTVPSIAEGGGLFAKVLIDGFNKKQIDSINSEGIYVLPESRINLGSLKENQAERVGRAILRALQICP